MFQFVAFVSFQKVRVLMYSFTDTSIITRFLDTLLTTTSGDFRRGISQSWGEHKLFPKLRICFYFAGTART